MCSWTAGRPSAGAWRGGRVGYQGRRGPNSCNSLFLADSQGLMLACSHPLADRHHGLFLNAEVGFGSQRFRRQCSRVKIEANIVSNPRNGAEPQAYVYFDEELYERRNVIEQANDWLDSFKALLIRFETKAQHRIALHFLAFTVQFIRKINQKALH